MKRIFYLLLWALGYCQIVQAQLTLTPLVSPNPSSNVYDWYYGKETAKLLVTNQTTNVYYAKLELKVYKDGVLMSHNDLTVTPIVTIRPSSSGSKVFEATDLLTPQCIRFDIDITDIKGQVLQGKMPAGYYTSCYSFLEYDNVKQRLTGNVLSTTSCKSYSVTSYQAPTLMLPMADTKINYTGINNTIFRWTNVVPAFNGILKYRFRIYEVLTGQTPWQAIKSNAPIEQRDVLSSTMHIWTSATAKIASRQTNGATELPYVWTVQALDLQNNPVGNNDGLSEARVFNVVLEKPKGGNGIGTAAGTGMVTAVIVTGTSGRTPSIIAVPSAFGKIEVAKAVPPFPISPPLPLKPINEYIKKNEESMTKGGYEYKLEIEVFFRQEFDPTNNSYICTTLGASSQVKRKAWLGKWKDYTADKIVLDGQFSGPRSPKTKDGKSGYQEPNPFSKKHISTTVHFVDYSSKNVSLFEIYHANYIFKATIDGKELECNIGW